MVRVVALGLPALLATFCALAQPQAAQPYPTRPVRFILPIAPGGGTDQIARIVGVRVGDKWGIPLVVDNRSGGGGTIGVDLAAKAVPDGYTILMGYFAPIGVNPSLLKLPYDPVRDFAGVSLLATSQNLLAVHPSVAAKTVKELIAAMRAKPGEFRYGSGGNGSAMHVSAELFNMMASVKMQHIPYKGAAPAVIDLMAGQVQISFVSVPSSIQYVKAGRVRAIAVAGTRRSPALPDVPTVDEAGLPGFESSQWYGVMVPRATPGWIVGRLHRDFVDALNQPDVKTKLAESGFELVGSTPAEFDRFIRDEIAKWAKVIKAANIRAD